MFITFIKKYVFVNRLFPIFSYTLCVYRKLHIIVKNSIIDINDKLCSDIFLKIPLLKCNFCKCVYQGNIPKYLC